MENLRKRIRVDLVRASENDRMRRLVADPAYLSHRIFDGDLVAIHSTKSKLKLNRPIYIGQPVLDNSKLLMYDFWYNHIKAEFGNKANLLYTDNAAGVRASRPSGAWTVGASAAGRVGGRAADTAWRASTVTYR